MVIPLHLSAGEVKRRCPYPWNSPTVAVGLFLWDTPALDRYHSPSAEGSWSCSRRIAHQSFSTGVRDMVLPLHLFIRVVKSKAGYRGGSIGRQQAPAPF